MNRKNTGDEYPEKIIDGFIDDSDDDELPLSVEAERIGWQRDPPDPDDIYFEDTDEVIDEAVDYLRSQPTPTVVPRNKRTQALHELCDTIARNHQYH